MTGVVPDAPQYNSKFKTLAGALVWVDAFLKGPLRSSEVAAANFKEV